MGPAIRTADDLGSARTPCRRRCTRRSPRSSPRHEPYALPEGDSLSARTAKAIQRFCSTRCRRIAERQRYRLRNTANARCPRCGKTFERTTTSKRLQVYCSLRCQYESRAAEYARREDIQESIARARTARHGGDTREARLEAAAKAQGGAPVFVRALPNA